MAGNLEIEMSEMNLSGDIEVEEARQESTFETKSNAYHSTITQAFSTLMDSFKADKADGWKYQGKKQGVTKHKKNPEDGKVAIFRGEKVLDFEPHVLLNALLDRDVCVALGNGTIADLGQLEQVEEHCYIKYENYKVSVPFVAPRDIVYVHIIHTLPDGTILSFGSSVEHPDRPQKDNCVRAELGIGGWAFKPIPNEPGKTKVVYVGQIDFAGYGMCSLFTSLYSLFQSVTDFDILIVCTVHVHSTRLADE